MQIKNFELHLFNRFKVEPIDTFVIQPKAIVQLIVGTNGSGKSSLLEEMSPLPSNPANFFPGGYSLLEFTYRGKEYKKKSSISPTRHSLCVLNDEWVELNPSGTAAVQRELCRSLFNITPQIHTAMIGKSGFSTMSPSDRKKWFTMMSDTSYDYATGMLTKLKQRLRDAQGAVKYNQNRLLKEKQLLMDDEQKVELENELASLKEWLDELISHKSAAYSASIQTADIEQYLGQYRDYLNKRSMVYNDLTASKLPYGIDQINQLIGYNNDMGVSTRGVINRLNQEMVSVADLIEKATETDGLEIESVEARMAELSERMAIMAENQYYNFTFASPELVYDSINQLEGTLLDLLINLPVNNDIPKRYSPAVYDSLTDKHNVNADEIRRLEAALAKSKQTLSSLEHRRDHNQVTCPACSHVWATGFSDEIYAKEKYVYEQLGLQTEAFTKQNDVLKKSINEVSAYLTAHRQYQDIARTNPVLNQFWQYLKDNNLLFTDPSGIGARIADLRSDLFSSIDMQSMKKELEHLSVSRQQLLDIKNNSLDSLKAKYQSLDKELRLYKKDLHELKLTVDGLMAKRDALASLAKRRDTLMSELEQQQIAYMSKYNHALQSQLSEYIRAVQLIMNDKERRLATASNQQAIVSTLESEQLLLEEDVQVLSILAAEMNNLVTKGMTGFINVFVQQMNSFISKVWTYPIIIQAPQVTSKDDTLDIEYKFSMVINDNPKPVPDASDGSTSMKQIIDLAFVIVAMRYLDLADHPLFLDEFAGPMDAVHRVNAYHTVNSMLAKSTFSNVFFISHYEDLYKSFSAAETTVVSSANIN